MQAKHHRHREHPLYPAGSSLITSGTRPPVSRVLRSPNRRAATGPDDDQTCASVWRGATAGEANDEAVDEPVDLPLRVLDDYRMVLCVWKALTIQLPDTLAKHTLGPSGSWIVSART